MCVSPTILDDIIPSFDDYVNYNVSSVDDDYIETNSSYLFNYIDVSCVILTSSIPTSYPSALPTLAPTTALVEVAVNQVIQGTTYEAYLNASDAYINSITEAILG